MEVLYISMGHEPHFRVPTTAVHRLGRHKTLLPIPLSVHKLVKRVWHPHYLLAILKLMQTDFMKRIVRPKCDNCVILVGSLISEGDMEINTSH
jgi:hypothetical protein